MNVKVAIVLSLVSITLSVGALAKAGHAAPPIAAGPAQIQFDDCAGGRPSPYIIWEAANAGQQWLDLSLFDNGFAPGTFLGVGPLDADRSAYIWNNLLPNTIHYARVNTLTASGWQVGPTASFTTSDCSRRIPAMLGEVQSVCEGGALVGVFGWTLAVPIGHDQWLDLSTVDNGFAPGTFISAGPLNPAGSGSTSFRWRGLLPFVTHYWRVNTWTGTDWVTSATGRFTTLGIHVGSDSACSLVIRD